MQDPSKTDQELLEQVSAPKQNIQEPERFPSLNPVPFLGIGRDVTRRFASTAGAYRTCLCVLMGAMFASFVILSPAAAETGKTIGSGGKIDMRVEDVPRLDDELPNKRREGMAKRLGAGSWWSRTRGSLPTTLPDGRRIRDRMSRRSCARATISDSSEYASEKAGKKQRHDAIESAASAFPVACRGELRFRKIGI